MDIPIATPIDLTQNLLDAEEELKYVLKCANDFLESAETTFHRILAYPTQYNPFISKIVPAYLNVQRCKEEVEELHEMEELTPKQLKSYIQKVEATMKAENHQLEEKVNELYRIITEFDP